MRKATIFLTLCCVITIGKIVAQNNPVAVFPYENSLQGTDIADVIRMGYATFQNDGIQLTAGTSRQSGSIILDGVSFSSGDGIVIEFEYEMYAGFKDPANVAFGDGIAFFLFDASVPYHTAIGAYGSGLGYSSNRSNIFNGGSRVWGINKAYLGIGLDQFGNFKKKRFDATSRTNGIDIVNWGDKGISHVTLRGAMHPTGLSYISAETSEQGVRYAGYPVLATKSTVSTSGMRGQYLNLITNSSTSVTYSTDSRLLASEFELRGGAKGALPGALAYRKAILELLPVAPASGGGYKVSVTIVHGSKTTNVINNFHYKEAFYYVENANSGSTNNNSQLTARNTFLEATPPAAFKIGFSAGTGDAAQVNLIKNLKITLPYHPEVKQDETTMCRMFSTKVSLDIFDNDKFYNGILDSPTASNTAQYIDFSSFHFVTNKGVLLHKNTYVQENVGTWVYNENNGKVTFTPVPAFFGDAFIYYNAKGTASLGGPFNQDNYRSEAKKILVKVESCGSRSNPQTPSS